MKPCIMALAYLESPGADWENLFDFAVESGIGAIDFCYLPENPPPDIGRMHRKCLEYRVAAACHTVFNDVNAPGMTPALWRRNIRKIIDGAAELETGKIMIPTSGSPRVPREECRKQWYEALNAAVEYGKRCGIEVTIESFVVDVTTSPFVTADDLLAAVKQVPGLKVTFDSGNHFVVESVLEAYRKLKTHIAHVHFKDWEILPRPEAGAIAMSDGKFYRMTVPGTGVVDNDAVLKEMIADHLQTFFDIEYAGKVPAAQGIEMAWQHWKPFIDGE